MQQKLRDPDVYPPNARRAFQSDLARLEAMGIHIDRTRGRRATYTLQAIPAALIPLGLTPEEADLIGALLNACAGTWLRATTERLRERLAPLLPPDSRRHFHSPVIQLHLALRDPTPDPVVLERLGQAVRRQQRVDLIYHQRETGSDVRHTGLEPLRLFVDEGHLYLLAYAPARRDRLYFRVQFIRAVTVRVDHFSPRAPGRRYHLRYRLHPRVAREGATRHFDDHHETVLPDGWVEVTATWPDLFWPRRKLLAYGPYCVVLEPPELVEALRREVALLAQTYGLCPTPTE